MAGSKQQQMIVLGVLLVVMAAIYVRAWRSGVSGESEIESVVFESQILAEAPKVRGEGIQEVREVQRSQMARMEWGRDPFSRVSRESLVSELVLTGIVWDPAQPIAIINGVTVRVGERVGNYKVSAIKEDEVSLSDGTETFQLNISP